MLEAMISVDNWLNETTRHADVILPGLSPLEQPHHDDLVLQFAIRSFANYSAPVFDPGDRPQEWEILIRLTGLCTGTPAEDVDVGAIDDGFFDYLAFTRGFDGATIRKLYDHGGPERMLDLTLRTGPFGDRYGENPGGLTLNLLKANPNGIDFGPMVSQLPDILGTADKKVRLAPQYLLDDLSRLAARLERPADPLVLVNRRHLRSNNSWLHNVPALMKGKDRCTLLMHPRGCGPLPRHRRGHRHGEIGVRRDQGAGRDHRCDQAGGGVDAARLGPRQAGNPAVGGQRFAGGQHQCPVTTDADRRAVREWCSQWNPGDRQVISTSVWCGTRPGLLGPFADYLIGRCAHLFG